MLFFLDLINNFYNNYWSWKKQAEFRVALKFFYRSVISGVAQHLKGPKQMSSELELTMLDL